MFMLRIIERQEALSAWRGSQRFLVAGQQFLYLLYRLTGQAPQHIQKIVLRIDTAAATHENGVDNRAAPAGRGVTDEKPALFPNDAGTNRVFGSRMPTPGLCRVTRRRWLIERVSALEIVADAA
jgi:hypothetical protein